MGEDQRNHSDKGFFHHLAGYASGRYRPHGHHGYNNHGHHGYGVPYAYPAPPPPYGYPPVAYPPHGGYPPPGYPPHGYPGQSYSSIFNLIYIMSPHLGFQIIFVCFYVTVCIGFCQRS